MTEIEDSTAVTKNSFLYKPPLFNSTDPELWFGLLERDFRVNNIDNDAQKTNITIKGLPMDIQIRIKDVIVNNVDISYNDLKSKILAFTTKSEDARVQQINTEVRGDKTPSQFLQHLLSLQGNPTGEPCMFIKRAFYNSVSPQIALILKSHSAHLGTLDKVAALADDLCAQALLAQRNINNINNNDDGSKTSSSTNTNQQNFTESISNLTLMQKQSGRERDDMQKQIDRLKEGLQKQETDILRKIANENSKLQNQVEQLEKEVERLRSSIRGRDREVSRSFSRNSKYRNNYNYTNTLCYYHNKFGGNATKCVPGCTFQPNVTNSSN